MGSNALRLSVWEYDGPGRGVQLIAERYPLRLGHDVFLSGRISDDSMRSAVQGLAQFKGKMAGLDTVMYRAIATSAVRESANADQFIQLIRNETGLEVHIISGSEEARLIHRAVLSRIPLGNQQWIIADLGGGSVEVSLADVAGVLWSESHTMGSVRLLEELRGGCEEPGRFRNLLAEYISTLRIPSMIRKKKPSGFIATGGNIESLAELAGLPEEGEICRLKVADLHRLIDKLACMSVRDRMLELDLRADRADIILPAALVYERLAVLAGADEIIVPRVGLREGLILDLLHVYTHREDQRDKQVAESALTLGRKYLFEEKHARQVARFAVELFDQLKPVHGMGEADRRILLAASLLHDIGSFISFKKHHKHSLYIISQSELPGFSPEEMLMAGNVARYHRKSTPAPRHDQYMKLSRENRDRVCRLAAIIRMADALDREHLQKVTDIRADVQSGKVLVLRAGGKGDLLLERWALGNKSRYFSELFDMQVRYHIEGDE